MTNKDLIRIYDEYSAARSFIKGLLQICFDNEELFKVAFLRDLRWKPEEYEIKGLHISSNRVKVCLQFDDYSEYTTFLDLDTVFEWSLDV